MLSAVLLAHVRDNNKLPYALTSRKKKPNEAAGHDDESEPESNMDSESDSDMDDGEVYLRAGHDGSITVTGQLEDYLYRDVKLANVHFYRFVSEYKVVPKPKRLMSHHFRLTAPHEKFKIHVLCNVDEKSGS